MKRGVDRSAAGTARTDELNCAAAADHSADVGAAGDNLASGRDQKTAHRAVCENDLCAAADRYGADKRGGLDRLRPARENRVVASKPIDDLGAAGDLRADIRAVRADDFTAGRQHSGNVAAAGQDVEHAARYPGGARGTARFDHLRASKNRPAAGQAVNQLRAAGNLRTVVGAALADDFHAAGQNPSRIGSAAREHVERAAARYDRVAGGAVGRDQLGAATADNGADAFARGRDDNRTALERSRTAVYAARLDVSLPPELTAPPLNVPPDSTSTGCAAETPTI